MGNPWNARAKCTEPCGAPRGVEGIDGFTSHQDLVPPHNQAILSSVKLSFIMKPGRGRSWGVGKKGTLKNIRLPPPLLDPQLT